jgi:predicted metal-dependent hydrolase
MKKDMQTLQELYKFMCSKEGIAMKALRFCRVGRGGAKCTYSGKRVYSISIDLERIAFGAAYVLCHEVAHQILIEKDGNALHNKAFKKEEARLVKAYATCSIANKLIF